MPRYPLISRWYLQPFRLKVLLPLLAIATALTCTTRLVQPRSSDAPAGDSASRALSPLMSSTPIYVEPGDEALRHANDYLTAIDKAGADGQAVLRGGDNQSILSQARYFNALVNSGYAQFGSSYYEPLGSCGVAGSSARHLWHVRLRAMNGQDHNDLHSELSQASAILQSDRVACLQAASEGAENTSRWAPALLSFSDAAPRWQLALPWPQ
ncbi:hypothetical protein JVX91_02255 [Pseudomonas sp. PDNC002]|uniref:hypothetical protein n=1 Tax=Pseudomonas sp. PDNC002 TaxID=2811422 RepID=UPI001962C86B|nr:hypothetical protein [Pseudomonas sp. PDNC002]QRY79962.1 hypothetical protein JVX91_02255 [Pseudomonas sp. PDNC002]